MAELEIRPARDTEIDPVAEMWSAMYAYQREHGMQLAMRDDGPEIWKRQAAGRLDSPVSVILVAQRTDAPDLSGFLAAQVKRLPAHLSTGNPKVGYISEMYVRPEDRRHRIGRALVDAAFDWFARADVGSIELQVLVGSDGARAFWQAMGFAPELLQMRAWCPRGEAPDAPDRAPDEA